MRVKTLDYHARLVERILEDQHDIEVRIARLKSRAARARALLKKMAPGGPAPIGGKMHVETTTGKKESQ